MANLITLSRLILLLLVVWIFYQPVEAWHFASFFLIILIFVSDGLDGYIARKRNETSLFGALFDIAGDRVVELTLWVVAADVDLVPIFVPLIFIIRGVVVDTIRSSNSVSRGVAPFALMRSPIGKFLVAGKAIRILYAAIKACAFCGLALLAPFPAVLPSLWAYIGRPLTLLTYAFVYSAVALCILRGLPVIVEFVYGRKEDIIRNGQSKS
ncbi:MAG TPA: CDP-alcohol phosphatidyltransferase family protein [Gammaproteobacteria bacterium]|nr:CDP-alcohol phosphatidyltransferase family protein [Gammaproteobacteria bacterium]